MTNDKSYFVGRLDNRKVVVSKSKIVINDGIEADRIFLDPAEEAEKIRQKLKKFKVLSEFYENGSIDTRGGPGDQTEISSQVENEKKRDSIPFHKGENVQRYAFAEEKYLPNSSSYAQNNQREISIYQEEHIEHQRQFSQNGNNAIFKAMIGKNDIPINTVTCIFVRKGFDLKYLLGLLNSRIVSFYLWKFIYCDAIRGMDIYRSYIGKLPIPNANESQQKEVALNVEKIIKHIKTIEDKPKIKNYLIEPIVRQRKFKEILHQRYAGRTTIGDQNIQGVIQKINTKKDGNEIIFEVEFRRKNSSKIEKEEILRIEETEESISEFITRVFEKIKNDDDIKKLYQKITDTKLPFYGRNYDEHWENVSKMYGKFFEDDKKYKRWLDGFMELDITIDKQICELYGLDDDDFKFIMENSRPAEHTAQKNN
tara:strand:+ start:1949 stop:3223 length:1275 start_codon:yes stop_codon:yes gene_type:complete